MKFGIFIITFVTLTSASWAMPKNTDIAEENLYNEFRGSILSPTSKLNSVRGFSAYDQSLYVDALWDLTEEGSQKAIEALDNVNTFSYELIERLRIGILRIKYNRANYLSPALQEELTNVLMQPIVDTKIIYTMAAYEAELLKAGHKDLVELAKTHPEYSDVAPEEMRTQDVTDHIVGDLFYNTPDVSTYMNGEYAKAVKIFMFCRENRIFPCLLTMRNIHGEILRNADGTIWTQPSLASSKHGLPSYSRNGNTPAGIMTIDSVMPYADQTAAYGKFRRMILNFIPPSRDEALIKSLLPESSHGSDWWKPTLVARDMGRNLFRIHGAGVRNPDPTTPYFPFQRTSGCIAQRENTYDGIVYKDQRLLLDTIMKAMDLRPSFENEVKIKGIIFIIEIDDKSGAVTADDLLMKGIE